MMPPCPDGPCWPWTPNRGLPQPGKKPWLPASWEKCRPRRRCFAQPPSPTPAFSWFRDRSCPGACISRHCCAGPRDRTSRRRKPCCLSGVPVRCCPTPRTGHGKTPAALSVLVWLFPATDSGCPPGLGTVSGPVFRRSKRNHAAIAVEWDGTDKLGEFLPEFLPPDIRIVRIGVDLRLARRFNGGNAGVR